MYMYICTETPKTSSNSQGITFLSVWVDDYIYIYDMICLIDHNHWIDI